MFSRLCFIAILIFCVIKVHHFKYIGSLTEDECKSYMASDNINKQLQAIFSCPRKWRFNYKRDTSDGMKYYLMKTG
ncbi:unnamed protein product [Rotaria magnacalcarata]|uniref:Uncharacterized protein n=1 Tax=Rotaria magnacalcarata TaxID=392030 RepID=A0A816YJ51_9BILA|nr:unnamed protein product [Rotaria magnacalcarata]CAF1551492.1 unnamed protein product [Rotaria magnacalcarata]CAF2042081.1 unnamed protein product [Rotaria magnacalcarata]CAF2159984.1 unnamed protein product [Rotaria magnacalcarata]CAF2194393.1 unnamed protein product [Rotaria magnacalcarata]